MTQYEQIILKEPVDEMPLKANYYDYIAWLKHQDTTKEAHFWRHYLKEIETPTRLPFRESMQDKVRSESLLRHDFTIPSDLATKAYHWTKEKNTTLSTLMQTALALVLNQYTQSNDVTFGLTFSGRPAEIPWVDEIVGCMINTLPFFVHLKSTDNIINLINQIQETTFKLIDYQHSSLAKIQQWSKVGSSVSLFDTLLIFENAILEEGTYKIQEGGLTLEEIGAIEHTNYPLTVIVYPDKGLRIQFEYDSSQINIVYIEQFTRSLTKAIELIVGNINLCLSELNLLEEKDQHQLLVTWNNNEYDFPKE